MQLGGREGGFALAVGGLSLSGAYGVYAALITRVREMVWIVMPDTLPWPVPVPVCPDRSDIPVPVPRHPEIPGARVLPCRSVPQKLYQKPATSHIHSIRTYW